ncbi:MAG: hypothetical protein WEA80_06180 [Gemmatimonadaceae bacterium]
MLEDTLAKIEQLAAPSFRGLGNLTSYERDLPPGFAAEISSALAVARERVTLLASYLQLQPRRLSRERLVRALLISEIVRLDDSTADTLRRYGTVDRRVVRKVEPMLHELRELLISIASRLDAGQAKSR